MCKTNYYGEQNSIYAIWDDESCDECANFFFDEPKTEPTYLHPKCADCCQDLNWKVCGPCQVELGIMPEPEVEIPF